MQEYYLNLNHDYIHPTIFRFMTHQSPYLSGGVTPNVLQLETM